MVSFSHGYNQEIFKNLRELTIAEAIDLLDNELQTLELKTYRSSAVGTAGA